MVLSKVLILLQSLYLPATHFIIGSTPGLCWSMAQLLSSSTRQQFSSKLAQRLDHKWHCFPSVSSQNLIKLGWIFVKYCFRTIFKTRIWFVNKTIFVINCDFSQHWTNNSNRHFYLPHIDENLLSWQFFQLSALVFTEMCMNGDVSCDLYIIRVAGRGSQHPFRPLRAAHTWHTADTLS